MQGNEDWPARPAWFHNDIALASRLAARDDDPAVRGAWRPLVQTLRLCDALITRQPRTLAAQERMLDHALAALRRVARRLPPAGPSDGVRTWSQPLDDLRRFGPRPDLIDGLVATLADELADVWTCPEWLAATVDDLRETLTGYGAELYRLRHEGSLHDDDVLPIPYSADQRQRPLRDIGNGAAQRGA